ncbi:hypothetical protein DUI87_05595 [Hirundo rustica rustica]|uniref:Uncharacterized protein n=1 Tax=Hirundo rustica rustica TaxID=333673 RepID=A0A3M0KYR2_HIRRU|nr:hypothetical protein DUI87_05595 [Hirundo rustica rustica]
MGSILETHILLGSSWIPRKLFPLISAFSTHTVAQQPVQKQSQVCFGERPNILQGGEGSLCGAATKWGFCLCDEQGLVGESWAPREKSRVPPRSERDSPDCILQHANTRSCDFLFENQAGPKLQLTEGLHLKDDNWNFVTVDNSEQGTWPRVKGFELQEDKVQRMPPWRYLGLEIGKRTIVPQKLEIKAKIQTLADVHQLCGALNWCKKPFPWTEIKASVSLSSGLWAGVPDPPAQVSDPPGQPKECPGLQQGTVGSSHTVWSISQWDDVMSLVGPNGPLSEDVPLEDGGVVKENKHDDNQDESEIHNPDFFHFGGEIEGAGHAC